eukprot:1941346-Lingulodinium_polyedra.AAC.1
MATLGSGGSSCLPGAGRGRRGRGRPVSRPFHRRSFNLHGCCRWALRVRSPRGLWHGRSGLRSRAS